MSFRGRNEALRRGFRRLLTFPGRYSFIFFPFFPTFCLHFTKGNAENLHSFTGEQTLFNY